MESNKTQKNEWEEFLSVIRKNYKVIILFVACSCIVSGIITSFIPREYNCNAVIFPTESNSLDDAIQKPQFGYDVEADRLIQLLDSRTIRDSIMRKFNLVEYYKIDTANQDWYFRLTKKYTRDITFEKTRFMSIIISVRSRDPKTAAAMANEIINQLGILRERLLKSNIYLAINSLQEESASLKSDLDSLSGVVNVMARNRKDIQQYIQTEKYISMIFDKSQMADDETAKALQILVNQYNIRLSWYYDVQTRLKSAVLMSKRPLPSVYIIEPAIPNYKKSSPSLRMNLMVAFAFSSVFISCFLFFIHKVKNFKKKE